MGQELLPPEPTLRDKDGRWKPGTPPPNPTGENGLTGKARHDIRVEHFRSTMTVDDLQRIVTDPKQRRNYTIADWQILMQLKNSMTGKPSDMLRSFEAMNNRAWGKPVQTIVVNEQKRITQAEIDAMTDEQAQAAYDESLRS